MALSTIGTNQIASEAVTVPKVTDQVLSSRNLIINGAMTVDQRHDGSSFTVVNGNTLTGYVADRFRVNETSGAVITGQRVADAPVGFEYSSKLTVTTADASLGSTEFHRVIQPIEGKDISHLNWGTSNAKTLTLTFYVKSSLTGQYYVSVFNNAADRTLLKGYTISSADTWEKKTITIIGDQSGTWLTTNAVGIHLMWSLGTGSSYQSSTLDAYQAGFYMAKSDQVNLAATNGSTWQLTGVQLEVGDLDTPFESEDIGTTLAKCQRYYAVRENSHASSSHYFGMLQAYNTSSIYGAIVDYPVTMRSIPSVSQSGSFGAYRNTSANAGLATTIGTLGSTTHSWLTGGWGGGSGLTAGYASVMYAEAGAKLMADAEL